MQEGDGYPLSQSMRSAAAIIIVGLLLLAQLAIGEVQWKGQHNIVKRYVPNQRRWHRCFLTWSFRDPFQLFTQPADFLLAKSIIKSAIGTWQLESGNNLFKLIDISPPSHDVINRRSLHRRRVAHIDVHFARGEHGDLEAFDGRGGLVAHSSYPLEGLVHFDADEKWVIGGGGSGGKERDQSVDLRYVALHEIGHALGLRHSERKESVMNPYYSERASGGLRLSEDDIAGIRELFSHCKRRKRQ